MTDRSQFVAGGSRELGVQGQYLDGELHLVDHTLAGAVAAGEKLEVFIAVVSANAVDVMHSLFRTQITSKSLRHDVAVFHNMALSVLAASKFRNIKPYISMAFGVFFVPAVFKLVQCFFSLCINFAVVITVFLLFVEATARFTAFWVFFAARQTHESVARFACFAAASARALSRAVPRISSIFLVVRSNKVFHHRKYLTAFAAGEIQRRSSFGRNALGEAVRTSAGEAAIPPVFARETGKRLLAVFTDFLNRHSETPLFGDKGILLLSIENVK